MRPIDPTRRSVLAALVAAALLPACSLMPRPAPELDMVVMLREESQL